MILLIVRHGETLENQRRICQGQTHGTLSPGGIEEAKKIARRLKHFDIDGCYTSDLKRATDTTEYIRAEKPDMPVYRDKRLRERYFGSFEGKKFPEVSQEFTPPQETETAEEILDRLRDLLAMIEARHPDDTLLLVSHGFTIRVLLSFFKQLPTTELASIREVKNTSLSIVEKQDEDWRVILDNDTTHLDEK